jgi:hypothetical protein
MRAASPSDVTSRMLGGTDRVRDDAFGYEMVALL